MILSTSADILAYQELFKSLVNLLVYGTVDQEGSGLTSSTDNPA